MKNLNGAVMLLFFASWILAWSSEGSIPQADAQANELRPLLCGDCG